MIRKNTKLVFHSWNFSKLNTDLPISLKEFEIIINKIHKRYPIISKTQISFIIKYFMEELRQQLLNGNMININDFATRLKLYSYYNIRYNKLNINTTVQLTTPKKIREDNVR